MIIRNKLDIKQQAVSRNKSIQSKRKGPILSILLISILLMGIIFSFSQINAKSNKEQLENEIAPNEPELRTKPNPILNLNKPRWKYIVIHHSATDLDNLQTIDLHHNQKFKNNGALYHLIIGNGKTVGDGVIQKSERWKLQLNGGHVQSHTNEYNEWGIGICLIGKLNKHPPTKKQMKTLIKLTQYLMTKFKISPENVILHKSINQTSCPGKYFPYESFKKAIQGN